jgi:hypothetical protein
MTPVFWGTALSRKNGSSADGIHLLWTAPYAAGYSLGGYDIQRRQSKYKPEITCSTLSRPELDTLHNELHLRTPVSDISVRAAPCPHFPDPVPDSPVSDDGAELPCVDFGKLTASRTVDSIDGLQIVAFDDTGTRRPHAQLHAVGGVVGVDCANHLEITLPVPSRRVVVTLVNFAQPPRLAGRAADGHIVASAIGVGQAGQPEIITLKGETIVSLAVVAAADETLLLRLCWEPSPDTPGERCTRLDEVGSGEHPNPLQTAEAVFAAFNAQGAAMARCVVKSDGGYTGLDCGYLLRVTLTTPVAQTRLTLVTFAQPVTVRAEGVDGSLVGTASTRTRGQAESITITGPKIAVLEIAAPKNETLLLELCVRAEAESAPTPGPPVSSASSVARGAALAASALMLAAGPSTCLRYSLRLDGQHHVVEVVTQVPWAVAIAMREGKAVDSRFLRDASGTQSVTFAGRGVDTVLLHTGQRIAGLTVCVDVAQSPEDEEKEWAGVPYIAKGLQLPVRAVNPALGSAGDELALAESRLVAGEAIDASGFADLASTMNETVNAGPTSPMWYTTLTRERLEDPFIEMRAWPYGLSITAVAEWRRALGFGYLDGGSGLVSGARYDYRITGHFGRRDIEERLLAFHTIPSGTTLPATFHLGTVRFTSAAPKVVELYPAVPLTTLRGTGRKGIRLTPVAGFPAVPGLTIGFDAPVTHVALEMEPALAGALDYQAKTSDFILGLSGATATGSIAAAPRVTLEFAEPIDTLELRGTGFLYGVRVLAPDSGDPDDVLDLSVIVPDVQYTTTAPPPPPPVLGTTNLQQPILPGDPKVTTQSPPQPLGFRLTWLPPAPSGGSPPPWPPDLGAVPPFDVLGFHLERRRVDTDGLFEEIDGQPAPTVFFGNRGSRADPPALEFGIDVLGVFPEVTTPTPPVDPWMSIDDILRSAARSGGPPPGSLHQYRVFSVDAIGRRSATATTGSIVRLEKRIPPPRPPGPSDSPPPGVVRPAGVRARVLQASDPDLAADDVALLGASTNAVVLEWGWTADERDRDPFATEFRVYWQPLPPDLVRGTLHAPATLVSGLYEMSCTLEQPLAADAMKGAYLRAPAYPFKIASHTGGTTITVRFEPSVLHPGTVPDGATFEFTPILSGTELRPSAWQERTAVVAIAPGPPPPFVFRDRLALDAGHPRARVWVGVSSADAQLYVPDELPAAVLNGGRPGNESSIAAAVAEARYLGRPSFVVPPPLPAVPEDVSPEPVGPTVSVARDLPALLPAVVVPAGHSVVLDHLETGALAAAMSNRPDGTIGVLLPDSSTTSYALANPADQAALRDEIGSGEPARIENRFLMDLFLRYQAQFEALWQRALPTPVAFAVVTDILPSKAERWMHRIRLVDAAGHISEGAGILPRLVRVASTRSPSLPEITMENSATDSLAITARVRQAFDLRWVVLFALAVPDPSPLDARVREKAQLLRIPDRRDLYPTDGIRLRLADGTLLASTEAVDIAAAGIVEVPEVRVPATLTPGFARRVSVWAITMTRDGIPSRLTGPVTAHTGPPPVVVPDLVVTSAGGTDTAMWGPLAVPAEVSIERSTDGGARWIRVSPWLPPTSTTYTLPGSGPRIYRLMLRGTSGQPTATGPPITLT